MSNGFCPFAVNKNIPPGPSDPAIKPRVAILHVDAGNAESLYSFFKDKSGGIESHFHVRKDGVIEQYRSIWFQADANYKANDFAISIETQGYAAGEWTAAQVESIKRLLLWLNKEAGIPLAKVKTWNGSGVGYHTLFGSPSNWTPVAKSCPGPDRIKQFDQVIVPWLAVATQDPKALPPRVQKAIEALGEQIDKATAEIKRLKKARKTAKKLSEPTRAHKEAIKSVKAARSELKRARRALKKASKR